MRRAPRNSLPTPITLALIAPALTILAPAAAHSAPPSREAVTRQEIQDAERARAAEAAAQQQAAARAARAAADEQRMTADRIAAAARLRKTEAATEDVAIRMDTLAARRREAQTRLDARARAMQPLLPLIERLSLYPVETLLAVPGPPETTLRGVLVLQGLSRQLEQEARALRHDQDELDTATMAVTMEAPKLAAAQAAQAAEAAALDRQIAAAQAQRHQAETEAREAAMHVATEAAHADTLRAVLSTLEVQRRADEARAKDEAVRAERHKRVMEAEAARRREAALARPAGIGTIAANAQPKGQLVAPVAGKVVRAWGEMTEGGPAAGISYNTPPAARVVSPCGGRVVFADAFRSYGLLLIVDCGGGYHAVLAGFERLDLKVGQTVQAGEPVGVMPSWEAGTAGRRQSLYVELRHDGQPVNPAPWLKSNS